MIHEATDELKADVAQMRVMIETWLRTGHDDLLDEGQTPLSRPTVQQGLLSWQGLASLRSWTLIAIDYGDIHTLDSILDSVWLDATPGYYGRKDLSGDLISVAIDLGDYIERCLVMHAEIDKLPAIQQQVIDLTAQGSTPVRIQSWLWPGELDRKKPYNAAMDAIKEKLGLEEDEDLLLAVEMTNWQYTGAP